MKTLMTIVFYRALSVIFWLNVVGLGDGLGVYVQSGERGALKTLKRYDFTSESDGDATAWLRKNGFEKKLDADALKPRFEGGSLVLSTMEKTAGLLGKEFSPAEYLQGIKKIRVEWGVRRYPIGADWGRGINRVPIAVMVTYGTERFPSGLPFGIQDAPRFISAFIGYKEIEGRSYVGKYWKEGGRYVCVASGDRSGDTIVSELELEERFKATYRQISTPPITAFAFQMNTEDTTGGAEAFIRKVEFIGK